MTTTALILTMNGVGESATTSSGSAEITVREADMQKKFTDDHILLRIDTQMISNDQSEVRLFMTVRNEILRLPRTFEHYRKIGVSRFFVVDNGSTDGSKEFLLAQPDCHVFVTHNSFAEAEYGLKWQNALLDEHGVNHWCLLVDADEWFTYAGYESRRLPELAAYLEQNGAQGVFAFLLDLYGPGTIAEAISDPQRSLLDACRYFDSKYEWYRHPRIAGIEAPRFPEYDVFGGPRLRLYFPNLHRYYHLIRLLWRTLDFVPLPLPPALQTPPTLTKIPFVRWLPGTRYINSHATTPIKLSEVTGVLLHFKFLNDFYERVANVLKRKEHVPRQWVSEHARYMAKLVEDPGLSFHYAGSVQYEGSEQLVLLGLLREDQGWMHIRANADDSRTPAEKAHYSAVPTQPERTPVAA
jgi:hypothetical protein